MTNTFNMITRTVLIITLFLATAATRAQSKYFVYLQTEPAQPFYIIINNQNISANTSGYLILPQLKEGDYKLVVGFPLNKYPEQTYNFKIDSKDKGYLIKNFGADGWGLFDLQTMAVQKPFEALTKPAEGIAQAPKQETLPREEVSDFTKVLSKAANDPSLLEKPKPQPPAEKPKPVVKEQPPAEKPKPIETVVKEEPVKKAEEVAAIQPAEESKPVIAAPPIIEQRKAEENAAVKPAPITASQAVGTVVPVTEGAARGATLVYDDTDENGNVEKVTVFIPEPKKAFSNVEPPQAAKDDLALVNQRPEKPNRFEVKEMPPIPQEEAQPVKQEPVAKAVVVNNDCNKTASEDDFLKLRRQMAKKDNDEEMIEQAKTAFKTKCYTTAQIKYLSSMFLSNAGKYHFYEASLSHVSDPQNFNILINELKDSFYKSKFEALIGR